MKTLVIGLGNPILTDDGVGIHVARALRSTLSPSLGIDVVELSVGGLALMEAMLGYDRVILIDGYCTPAACSGQIMCFSAAHLSETLNTRNTHDVDLSTALHVGRRLGGKLPRDECIEIMAIGVTDVLTFGEIPTPNVALAIPRAVRLVQKLLKLSQAFESNF